MTPEQREELTLAPCPFCSDAMEPFGPAQHNHPRNDCWLSSVRILANEYELWNRRAQVEALTVPQVAVSVERGGVYIIKGVQSFRLAYEGETRGEQEWYAGVLRKALAAPTIPAIPGTKEGA